MKLHPYIYVGLLMVIMTACRKDDDRPIPVMDPAAEKKAIEVREETDKKTAALKEAEALKEAALKEAVIKEAAAKKAGETATPPPTVPAPPPEPVPPTTSKSPGTLE